MILAVFLLTGCQPWTGVDAEYDPLFSSIPSSGLNTITDICKMVASYTIYTEEATGQDYWQSPDQTWAWDTGDCEDIALLAAYFIHHDLGGWPYIVIGKYKDFAPLHVWIGYEGRQYEVQKWRDVTDSPDYRATEIVSYGVAMWRSLNGHF
jgi:hypothetical protein